MGDRASEYGNTEDARVPLEAVGEVGKSPELVGGYDRWDGPGMALCMNRKRWTVKVVGPAISLQLLQERETASMHTGSRSVYLVSGQTTGIDAKG